MNFLRISKISRVSNSWVNVGQQGWAERHRQGSSNEQAQLLVFRDHKSITRTNAYNQASCNRGTRFSDTFSSDTESADRIEILALRRMRLIPELVPL